MKWNCAVNCWSCVIATRRFMIKSYFDQAWRFSKQKLFLKVSSLDKLFNAMDLERIKLNCLKCHNYLKHVNYSFIELYNTFLLKGSSWLTLAGFWNMNTHYLFLWHFEHLREVCKVRTNTLSTHRTLSFHK